ncbi:TonB-dependent receptor [Rufibacter radiotolerans]|uniref:TonB-dependent receptor n=1 Tax=Rufibacter radiotolerans TaxID=1379910 RepID=A0A0H4VP98_9BACT|nr:TonB-dependent receptor [Rufibacter radiotolerans]AKQ45752.1 TonB-dependent receptor [Rufibacter radiotolerans]
MAMKYLLLLFISSSVFAQTANLSGTITHQGQPIAFATVALQGTSLGSSSNDKGFYQIQNIPEGKYQVTVSALGYVSQQRSVTLKSGEKVEMHFQLREATAALKEVVISGTMKEVTKLESPVPVEVYTAKFFQANPAPSLFESMQHVNGVRPQLNCNVCNTGDIHINGLEGPYTMVLLDGMPIVSGLSTVYGLTGIPQALLQRVEVVKGPASTLYGSEAVGGLINIITKKPETAPLFSADVFTTTWGEVNADLGLKTKVGQKANSLLGVSYFNYQNPIDNNKDGFTDVTLQHRISLFNKWTFNRKEDRTFSVAGRYVYEDRWGGQMNWTPAFRGGDSIYGESIYTKRWELFGVYQLPVKETINFQFSTNGHDQNSVYGQTVFLASQYIGFGQLTWQKSLGARHDLLAGSALRYTYYDDNTPATAKPGVTPENQPTHTLLPGVFLQDEVALNDQNKVLLGLRYDYNSRHGSIFTPRLNYKWTSADRLHTLRLSAGNGYRVAHVFTEDHAALTGAREVVFEQELRPETSWNVNLNYVREIYTSKDNFIALDGSIFYTRFNNRILPDYDTNPNQIIYRNLAGTAVSKGISLNLDMTWTNGLKILAGGTVMEVYKKENGEKTRQLLTEKVSGVWNIGYAFGKSGFSIDYTGNVYGPMALPLLSPLDDRAAISPWWSIQNLQLTKRYKSGWEFYGGVKNLLNYTPPANSIARAFDPFDKKVKFNAQGQAMATPDNPQALTFDPTYVFAPNQGIRGFLGLRYTFQ